MTRLRRAWQALDRERRNAAVAALALLLTMFLPWFQQNGVVRGAVVSNGLDAFAVFSIVEAVVLLGALGVLALLFARAEARNIPLPESDGALVLGVGALASLLIFIRLFARPGVSGNAAAVTVGVEWGIFFALLAAGLLAWSGARLRAAARQRNAAPRPAQAPRRMTPASRSAVGSADRPARARSGARPAEQLSFEDAGVGVEQPPPARDRYEQQPLRSVRRGAHDEPAG